MSEERREELLDHNYDGIQEYDNPTPGWWHLIFWGTIVWGIIFVVVIQLTALVPDRQARFEKVEQAAIQKQFAELMAIDDDLIKVRTIMGDETWLAQGLSIYKGTCALCHGPNAEGLIGPNMTDDFYKNITDLNGMIDVIANGAANGAMPAQKNAMNENEIALVAGYMASLRNTNLEGKPPEGVEIPPFPEPITDESSTDDSGG